LDVENEWNHRFAGVLAHAAQDPGQRGGYYSPAWYSGPRLNRIATGGFAGALGSALATAAASASTAPGSSSGMGGGGFSGGGGGGCGGGGWCLSRRPPYFPSHARPPCRASMDPRDKPEDD